jgi:hypothetical protein
MERKTYRNRQEVENSKHASCGDWLSVLYSLGALLSLALAFMPALDAVQSTNCLVVGWLLALGAMLLNVLNEAPETSDFPGD